MNLVKTGSWNFWWLMTYLSHAGYRYGFHQMLGQLGFFVSFCSSKLIWNLFCVMLSWGIFFLFCPLGVYFLEVLLWNFQCDLLSHNKFWHAIIAFLVIVYSIWGLRRLYRWGEFFGRGERVGWFLRERVQQKRRSEKIWDLQLLGSLRWG